MHPPASAFIIFIDHVIKPSTSSAEVLLTALAGAYAFGFLCFWGSCRELKKMKAIDPSLEPVSDRWPFDVRSLKSPSSENVNAAIFWTFVWGRQIAQLPNTPYPQPSQVSPWVFTPSETSQPQPEEVDLRLTGPSHIFVPLETLSQTLPFHEWRVLRPHLVTSFWLPSFWDHFSGFLCFGLGTLQRIMWQFPPFVFPVRYYNTTQFEFWVFSEKATESKCFSWPPCVRSSGAIRGHVVRLCLRGPKVTSFLSPDWSL